MSKEREIEAKTILSPQIYQQLVQDFVKKQKFTQKNFYFDSNNNLLKNHQISCRIRIFTDRGEQTLKVPSANPLQTDYHEVIEITDALRLSEAMRLITKAKSKKSFTFSDNVGQYLSKHFSAYLNNLCLQTWSKTSRILAIGPHNCELTFDATSYPDGAIDYELEIENSNPALINEVLTELEHIYNFKQTPQNKNQNKIARAFSHKIKN